MANSFQYIAGIVHFGTGSTLEENITSLRAQSLPPVRIIVIDHGQNVEETRSLRRRNDDVEWIDAANRGYAAGANRVIAWADKVHPDTAYVLVMNPDIKLYEGYAQAVIRAMNARPRVALGAGKLLRPGASLIDSAGIEMARTRRFKDRGSEEPDDGRFGATETIFAVSGAALMVRRSVLPVLSINGEIFDEDFFVYHEDTDLAWRARKLGFQSLYVADALAVHVRGWRRGERGQIAASVRRHSFKNRYLEIIKNDTRSDFLRDLPFILAAEVARLAFAIFADRSVLAGYRDASRHVRGAWRKRRAIHRKIESMHSAS